MDVFAGAWASFDNIPLETTNGSEHPQNHTFEMQNAEWNGFLKSLEQENPTSGADLGFHDFVATSHGPSDPTVTMSGLPLGMPFSASSSSTSSTITPPDSATQPGLTWAASNPSGFNYSGFNHSSAVQPFQPWRPVQIYTQGHVNNLDREGLLIQVPPTPHSAGGYQCGNVDRTVVEDVPRGHLNAIMQSSDNLSHCSDHRSETFMDEIAGHDGDDESESPDPCYAQLLYRCLREAPDNTMSLKELYDWIQQHSQKAKDPKSRGWQNSVRHNLSMNAAFEKASSSASRGAKKGSLWRLSEKALREGVISTTRYRKDPKRRHDRKGYPAAPNRQQSGARGGQATRAATRRNRETHHAMSAPRSSPVDQHFRHQGRQQLDSGSPLFFHSSTNSPMPHMLPTPGPASPLFFGHERREPFTQLTSNPHTPPQMPLSYDMPAKPTVEKFELQHIDYPNGGLFGNHDGEHFEPATTPSLATETSFMSDDAMDSLMSPAASRETTYF